MKSDKDNENFKEISQVFDSMVTETPKHTQKPATTIPQNLKKSHLWKKSQKK